MKIAIVLLLLSGSASAAVIEAPVRAAPPALGAAARGAASVSFDGGPSLSPLTPVPGTPYMRYGPTLIDTRAPGSPALLQSIAAPGVPVIGLFETRTVRVVNSFMIGTFGVTGHSDAVPPGRAREGLGGYALSLGAGGDVRFWGSGSLPAAITPAVERAVLRFVGVRPAEENAKARMRRAWLRFYDAARALAAALT